MFLALSRARHEISSLLQKQTMVPRNRLQLKPDVLQTYCRSTHVYALHAGLLHTRTSIWLGAWQTHHCIPVFSHVLPLEQPNIIRLRNNRGLHLSAIYLNTSLSCNINYISVMI